MKRTILWLAVWAMVSAATAASAGFAIVAGDTDVTLSERSPDLQTAQSPTITDVPYAVETVAYSAATGNFYFWLDGFSVSSNDSICEVRTKFGIPANAQNEELIAQVKMAFLSGRKVNVYWDSETCTGGAPRPHYIKTYR